MEGYLIKIIQRLHERFCSETIYFEESRCTYMNLKKIGPVVRIYVVVDQKTTMVLNLKSEDFRYDEEQISGWMDFRLMDTSRGFVLIDTFGEFIKFNNESELYDLFEKSIEEARIKNIFEATGLFFVGRIMADIIEEAKDYGWKMDNEKAFRSMCKKLKIHSMAQLELEANSMHIGISFQLTEETITVINYLGGENIHLNEKDVC